jgi:aerobic carbon-monoxide dehydrogenase medium subunit
MKSAPFAYDAPEKLNEAVALLKEHGAEAKILAGGQSLVPLMNMRLAKPAALVDINRIAELRFIRVDQDGSLVIGAGARQMAAENSAEVAAGWPILVEALKLVGPSAERSVRAREAYLDYLTTVIQPDEVLTEVRFPAPADRSGTAFLEVSRRYGDFAMVAVAASVSLDEDGSCKNAVVALGGVGAIPVLAGRQNGELNGRRLDEATLREASQIYTAGLDPPDDVHADAAYRSEVAAVLTRRALAKAAERATKGA